ncbi:MAG: type II secretion system protein GspN [Polyangiales bacterium]
MERIPIKKILKWAGYPAFFMLCFVFFAYKTFPYDRLADRLVHEAQIRGYEIEIVDLTHSGLTGLTFESLRVVLPAEEGSPPLDVIFDELTVSTSLFSLFSDTKSFTFDAELAGGQAEGDLSLGADSLELEADIEDVALGAIPALRKFTKVPMTGTLNAEIDVSMPSEVAESTGNVELTIEALNLGDGETQLDIPGWGGLTLDRADAGNLELLATIDEGAATIERAESHGPDLKLDAVGRVRLVRPMKRSEVNLMVRVKIEDAYKERSAKVATMLELASAGLKSAMTPDGAIQYLIGGPAGGRLRPRAAGRLPFEAPK